MINMDVETHEMDPDGDVVVCLQDDTGDEVTTVTARCSSKVLSLASPVFKAMFLPTFSQGIQLQETGSTQIDLEEDDLPAMLIILNALHWRNLHVPSEPSRALLFEIAVLVDKYDLYQALRPWHELWLNKQRDTVLGGDEYEQWLFIAWIFQDSDIFKRITRKLVLETGIDWDKEIITRSGHKLPIGLPDAVSFKLRSGRGCLLEKILQYISGEIRDYTSRINSTREQPSTRCKQSNRCSPALWKLCDALSVAAIVSSISKHSLLLGVALVKESIFPQDLLAELKTIPKLGAKLHYNLPSMPGAGTRIGTSTATHEICGSHEELAAFAAECEESIVGLDLDTIF